MGLKGCHSLQLGQYFSQEETYLPLYPPVTTMHPAINKLIKSVQERSRNSYVQLMRLKPLKTADEKCFLGSAISETLTHSSHFCKSNTSVEVLQEESKSESPPPATYK